jgi:Na+ dependent nucleoside transporter C-terminus
MICSYVLWPFAVIMGVDTIDCRKVAQLIGTKTILNEFVAYADLSVIIGNVDRLAEHIANNGTWYRSGDDVIMTSPGVEDVVLANGIMSVRTDSLSIQHD